MIFRYGGFLRRFITGCGIFSLYFVFSFVSKFSVVNLPILSQIAVYVMILSLIYGLSVLFSKLLGYEINNFIFIGVILYSTVFLLIKNITNIPMIGQICGISALAATQLINVFLIGNAISNICISYCIGRWGLRFIGITGIVSAFVFLGVFNFPGHPFVMFFVLGCSISNILSVMFYYFNPLSNCQHYMLMISIGFLIPSSLNVLMMRNINIGLSESIFNIYDVVYGIFGLLLIISCFLFILSITNKVTDKSYVFNISFLNKNTYWLAMWNTLVTCIISVGIKDKIPLIAHLTGNYLNILQSLDVKGTCIGLFVLTAALFVFKPFTVLLACGWLHMIIVVMSIIVFVSNFYFTDLTHIFANHHNNLFIFRSFINNVIVPGIIILSAALNKSYMIIQFINSQVEDNLLSFTIFVGLVNFMIIFVSIVNILSYIPMLGALLVCFVCSVMVLLSTLLYKRQIDRCTKIV